MAFNRPTLSTIITRVKNDIRLTLGITTVLRRSFLGAFGRAIAGASHVLHGHLQYISEQIFPDVSELEFLERWANIWGVSRTAATFTQLNINITGDAGEIIPAGTEFQTSAGVKYTSDAETTIGTPTPAVAEQSKVETIADVAGNLDGKYFYVNHPSGNYYFWLNADAGGNDPGPITGRTGVAVPYASDDDADTIAEALRVAADALGDFSASRSGNVVTIVNSVGGSVEDANDFGLTGFTIYASVQGQDEITQDAQVVITAENPGSDTNLEDGDVLNFSTPLANVDSSVTVLNTVTEGEDVESDDLLRTRLLNRIQQPPSGGNANDYIQWAISVAGVTRAWVFPEWLGDGTVGVSFVQDDETDIIPGAAKVTEVQDYIDTVKPVTAAVTAFAPTPIDLNMTIKLEPNTQEVRDEVTAELQDVIFRNAQVAGAYSGPGQTYSGTILKSKLDEAISIANGENDHLIVTPAADFTVSDGELVRLGTITFQPL